MRNRSVLRGILSACVLAACLAACDGLPRDAEGTAARVAGGRLRVGLVEHQPWVVRTSGEPAGAEVELVRELAHELRAAPEWRWGGEEQHMQALEHFELDLVIGGLTTKTPWAAHVGLTRPYYEDEHSVGGRSQTRKHVMAVAPGENAWLKRVQTFLDTHRAQAAQLARGDTR
jgi:ABC-type amino acid transport substrate-binding protein